MKINSSLIVKGKFYKVIEFLNSQKLTRAEWYVLLAHIVTGLPIQGKHWIKLLVQTPSGGKMEVITKKPEKDSKCQTKASKRRS